MPSYDKLDQSIWFDLSTAEKETIANALGRELPQGFTFKGIQPHERDGRSQEIAEFKYENASFVLLPGGNIQLGYDPFLRSWEPNPDELRSWLATAEEYEIEGTIEEYIGSHTLKPRIVQFLPFLVETVAGEPWSEQVDDFTHIQVVERLAESGFRLPTSDEWEYSCSGGADTLFHWGNHVPCDRYPVDDVDGWDLHIRPNGFGIHIASDPYRYELVAEPNLQRGGDGGSMICGGAGFFSGWLALATSYFTKWDSIREPTKPISQGYHKARRVLPLG